MALFPEIDFDFEDEEVLEELEESTELGRVPKFDFDKGQYVIKDGKVIECTQEEAILQWIGFLIKTPADEFPVYDSFGTYISNLIGYKDASYVASEILAELDEKCTDNRAIESIRDFDYEKDNGLLKISFAVVTATDEELEMEVEIDV